MAPIFLYSIRANDPNSIAAITVIRRTEKQIPITAKPHGHLAINVTNKKESNFSRRLHAHPRV